MYLFFGSAAAMEAARVALFIGAEGSPGDASSRLSRDFIHSWLVVSP